MSKLKLDTYRKKCYIFKKSQWRLFMRRSNLGLSVIFFVAVLAMISGGCKKEKCNPIAMVTEADSIIASGGLENPDLRKKANDLYNRALTCDDVKLEGADYEFVQSHSHFGIAMVNTFNTVALVNTMLGQMGGGGGCSLSCGGAGCAGGCPSLCPSGGLSCSSCQGCSSGSCNIAGIRSVSDIKKMQSHLFVTGALNGLVYLLPLIFLFAFRIRRSIKNRKPDLSALAVILVLTASLTLAGLKPRQSGGECQPLELGNLKNFLEDAVTQIIGPIVNELSEVAKYKSFSMTLDSAKLVILPDNPFTTTVTDDPLYINLKGTYDYADVSFLLGTFQGVMGLVRIVFAYDIIDPLIAYITAPECSPNPLSIPGFGQAVATMSELGEIRSLLASSIGSFASAFDYIIYERGSQTNHLLNYQDTGIDGRSDDKEFGYDANNTNPDPAGDATENDGKRSSNEAAIQLVRIPSAYTLPSAISRNLKVFTTYDNYVSINNALPVGETFYDYGVDGKPNTWDKDKTYAANNVDGTGDGTGGPSCSTSNWCNPSASSCLPVCSTEGNGIYDSAATCGPGKPGEPFTDAGTDGKFDPDESGKYGNDGKPGVAGVDDDGDGIIDNESEWCPGYRKCSTPVSGYPGSDPSGACYGDDVLDPAGDDGVTECNGVYDPGEPYDDVGCDGIKGTAPDLGEGDGIWEMGLPGEPFNDFGIDGVPGTYDYGEADNYFQPYLLALDLGSFKLTLPLLPYYTIKQGVSYYDSNGVLHLASSPINWADVGSDGLDDTKEKSPDGKEYEPVCNHDPANDNYSASNPSGTEGNGSWEPGEPFLDWGNDTITQSGFVIGVPDWAESGFAGADPNKDDYSTNPQGTDEKNGKYDPGEIWQCSLTGYLFYFVLQALPALGIELPISIPLPTDIDQAAELINTIVSPILSKAVYLNEASDLLKSIQTSIMDDNGTQPLDLIPIIFALLNKFPGLVNELGSLIPDISSIKAYNALVGFAARIPPMVLYNVSEILETLSPLLSGLGVSIPPIAGIPAIDLGALFRNPPTNITSLLPMFFKEDEPCSGDCSMLEYFADINGNGVRDPFEYYEDTNKNGQYDPPSGTFTDIDGSGRWNRAGDIMIQRSEIETWWDVGDPTRIGDPAEGNGRYDRGEPFYDWGTDQLPDLYELSPWGPDGRPGVAFVDDDGDGFIDEPDEYLYGYDCSNPDNCPVGSAMNDDRYDRSNAQMLQFELGPDRKPGKTGFDDNCNGVVDDYGEYLNTTGTFGADGQPGVAGVDDDGNGQTDDITEFCYCRDHPGQCPGSDDTYQPSDDTSKMFGSDGKPGVPNVDDDGNGIVDDAYEYVYCMNAGGCPGSDDIRPPFGYDGLPGVGGYDDDGNNTNDNIGEYLYCQINTCPGNDDNPDPAGDNYDYTTNSTGTEKNGVYDSGEKYLDYGLDRKPGTGDPGENNGVYDAGDPFSNVGIDNKYDLFEPGYSSINRDPEFDNFECPAYTCSLIFNPPKFDYRTERSIAIPPELYPYDGTSLPVPADEIFKYTQEPLREAAAEKDPKWAHITSTGDPLYPLTRIPDKPHYWPITGNYEKEDTLPDSIYLFFKPPVLGGLLTIPTYHNGPVPYPLITGVNLPPERGFVCGTITYDNDKLDNLNLNATISLLTGLFNGEISLDLGL